MLALVDVVVEEVITLTRCGKYPLSHGRTNDDEDSDDINSLLLAVDVVERSASGLANEYDSSTATDDCIDTDEINDGILVATVVFAFADKAMLSPKA